MDFVYIYYDNPVMLERQIECWNSYVGILRKLPTILLVDDGSPQSSAAEVVRRCDCRVPIKVFRIQEDIPWNQPGARNLGCAHARGWIFISDMDALLPGAQARRLFEEHDLQLRYYYTLQRVRHVGLKPISSSTSAIVIHKRQFLRIGGFDEDYAGHYGKDDRDFLTRLDEVADSRQILNVTIQSVQRSEIKDASTRGLNRDVARNAKLYSQKQTAGFPKIGKRLRFSWTRVF